MQAPYTARVHVSDICAALVASMVAPSPGTAPSAQLHPMTCGSMGLARAGLPLGDEPATAETDAALLCCLPHMQSPG